MALSESFDKADGVLGPDLTWTVVFGNLEVASNEAVSPNISPLAGSAYAAETFVDDVSIEAVMGTVPSGPAGMRLFARWTDIGGGGENAYKLDVNGDTTDPTMSYDLTSFSGPLSESVAGPVLSEGQVVKLVCDGDSVKVYADSMLVHDVTSTDVPTGAQFGFGLDTGTGIASFGVDVPAPPLGTMFTPPSFGRIPTTVPYPHPGNVLQRNFRARQEGTNVYYLSDDTVTETDPDSITVFWHFYEGSPYVKRVFWGSTANPYDLTTTEAQVLTDAGYTLI